MAFGILAVSGSLLDGLSNFFDTAMDWLTNAAVHGTLLSWVSVTVVCLIMLIGMRK